MLDEKTLVVVMVMVVVGQWWAVRHFVGKLYQNNGSHGCASVSSMKVESDGA